MPTSDIVAIAVAIVMVLAIPAMWILTRPPRP